jgi:type VI secretion system protein ImpM
MAVAVLPGWYGKLPALGDFASRRLPPVFVEPWDRWLATGLSVWRDADPAWLEAYLGAPTWRFALGAGLPFDDSPGYAGVLMPSVDRVGRYFPLTVVRPRGIAESQVPTHWLQTIEQAALAALDDDWDADRFDAELGRLEDADAEGFAWPGAGRAAWWHARAGQPSEPMPTHGLPQGDALLRLLAGRLPPDSDPGEQA